MDVSGMDALSDWDDWSDDGPEWWLRHPLHRPRSSRSVRGPACTRTQIRPLAKKLTVG